MRVVRNQQDIRSLEGSGLTEELLQELEAYVAERQQELDELEPGAWLYEDTGEVIVLEAGDDPRDLDEVGLSDEGLFSSVYETVERIEFKEGTYFRVLVVYNDSYGVTFYVPLGVFEVELEERLEERVELLGSTLIWAETEVFAPCSGMTFAR